MVILSFKPTIYMVKMLIFLQKQVQKNNFTQDKTKKERSLYVLKYESLKLNISKKIKNSKLYKIVSLLVEKNYLVTKIIID